MIDIILLYITNNLRILTVFANFLSELILQYLVVANTKLQIKNVNAVIVIYMLIAYIRELFLINLNLRLKIPL
jgi:hypothetical protein